MTNIRCIFIAAALAVAVASTAAGQPEPDLVVEGRGKAVERIVLDRGLWVVEASASGSNPFLNGFSAKLVGVEDDGTEFLFIEMFSEPRWSGEATVRLGGFLQHPAGRQILEVDAMNDVRWSVSFTKER